MGLRRLNVEAAMKQKRAVDLRNVGFNYEQIAEELGYADKSGAWRAVKSACDRAVVESVQESRFIMANRLDVLLRAAMVALGQGDLDQILNVLRIEKRRAELFGIDSPKQVEVSGPGGDPIETDVGYLLKQRLAEIRERNPDAVTQVQAALTE